ncbi:hypothetical protein MTAT_04620 [Moorella thermoacetica]|uniref:von Willebrand factor type A domain protein n=1 Tax=Neomoorella thermoacetica TaxID=1525 RepID=A0AAC9HIV2_NEOTH|nr:vWA domain-containing protein [Moorella thermoacetica]AOQ24739.1 von Willebrand factor type A domain protein [Moorella thermoacetica]TYL15723.1 hypothetical protein MTAT_04620 [Moorella thermoacetica]
MLTGRWAEWEIFGAGDWFYDITTDVLINRANQSGFSGVYHPGYLGWTNYEIQATCWVNDINDDDGIGLVFRFQDQKNYYFFMMDNGSVNNGLGYQDHMRLGKVVNGKEFILGTARQPHPWIPTIQYKIKIEVIDQRIRVWVNNILQYDFEDNTFDHGSFGPVSISQPNVCFAHLQARLLPIKAFVSGIGDLDDGHVMPPVVPGDPVDFVYTLQRYYDLEENMVIYPPLDFTYSVWAEGRESKPDGPYPYAFNITAYPENQVTYKVTASGQWPASFKYRIRAKSYTVKPYQFKIRVNYTDAEGGSGGGKADIIWLIDGSGSMYPYQQAIKNNALSFTQTLAAKNIDYRLGVVGYCNYPGIIFDSSGNKWTTSSTEFGNMVTRVGSNWGDGSTENGLTAINFALNNYDFRPEANIFLVLVTDENADDYSNLSTTISNLAAKHAVVYGIINSSDATGYVNGGVIDTTGGVVESISTPDWSATLSNISGSMAARVDGYSGVITATAEQDKFTRVPQTVQQLILTHLGDLPPDIYTNSRYSINFYELQALTDGIELKFSTDGNNVLAGNNLAVANAYVYGRDVSGAPNTIEIYTEWYSVGFLPLVAQSDASKVAVTSGTAIEAFQLLYGVNRTYFDFMVESDTLGVHTSCAADGSSPVYAWAESGVTQYNAIFQDTVKVFAYEGEKVANYALNLKPKNSYGQVFPGSRFTITLEKLSGTADIYWASTHQTGQGYSDDKILVKTDESYQGPGGTGQIMAGEIQYYELPDFMNFPGVVHYSLEDISDNPVYFAFTDNPGVTTQYKTTILTTSQDARIIVRAPAKMIAVPWSSPSVFLSGRVNGKEPYLRSGDGKADIIMPLPSITIPQGVTDVTYHVKVDDDRVTYVFISGGLTTTNPVDKICFGSDYNIIKKVYTPHYSEEYSFTGRVVPGRVYEAPIPDIPGHGELIVRSLTPEVTVWIEDNLIKARLSGGGSDNWYPFVHTGQYYFGEMSHYLYASRVDKKLIPDEHWRVYLNPKPRQGAPVVIRDASGKELRKVAFQDEKGFTLTNTETFAGLITNVVYLLYPDLTKVEVLYNGQALTGWQVDGNKLMLPFNLKETDELVVKYQLRDSFYLDQNGSIKDTALVQLCDPSYDGQFAFVTASYESSVYEPYYVAEEIELNPINNHNHTGFLYISNSNQALDTACLNIAITPNELPVGKKETVTCVVTLTDAMGNPIPYVLIDLFFNDRLLIHAYTDSAGEVVYNSAFEAAGVFKAVCHSLVATAGLNRYEISEPNDYHLRLDLNPQQATNIPVRVQIRAYDSAWRPLANANVRLEHYNDSNNLVVTTLLTDVYGQAEYIYNATSTKRMVQFAAYYAGTATWAVLRQGG